MSIKALLPKESWFRNYISLWPTSEPPESFILFAAMSAFGGTLGRRVWFDHDVHTVYPPLNVLLIGASGLGKSTAAKIGFKLFKSLPREEQPQLIIGAPTPEKLHEDLKADPHAILFASELANFFNKQKYMEGLIPYVTELLDYGDAIERRTKTSSVITIENPTVTVLGCSTKDWLKEQLPDSAASGGFLARFLIVNEEHKARSVALPGRALSSKRKIELAHQRHEALQEFKALVTQNIGEITFESREVDDIYTQWYDAHRPAAGHLAPFAARAGEYVLRLSIILAVSCDRTIVTPEIMKSAIKLYEWTEKRLQDVVVPTTLSGKLQDKLLEAIGDGHMTEQQVRRAMRNMTTAQETGKLIDSLLMTGEIKRGSDGKLYKSAR